jgi:hypothetical protein
VFQQPGAHGAAVLTANGVEFHDVTDVPQRVIARDPYEPWRAPIGFLIPANGRFTKTSAPTVVATTGLAVSLRPSDTLVPAWGGEMLVRADVLAPAAKGAARWGEDVGIVLDGHGPDARALAEAALGQLGGRDRVVVVEAGGRVVVPVIPASHRSLVLGAIERALSAPPPKVRASAKRADAVSTVLRMLSRGTLRRVLVLADARGRSDAASSEGIDGELVPMAVVSASGGKDLANRITEIRNFLPPAGEPAFRDLVLAFEGTPAPSHVLEASGGDARWELQGGELALGDVRAGDERAEVVRVTIPAWTPGEAFVLRMTARFEDLSRGGERRTMSAELPCTYDENIERLAESRNGDVIAYASALATLARLDAAFLESDDGRSRDLRPIALMHARSLALLARDMMDPAAAEQAALLDALLAATQ